MIISGFLTAPVLIATLSAPFRRISRACCKVFTPPPTVNGISITSATFLTRLLIVSRCCSEAVISRNTSSSAPSLLYFSASKTGSPASLIDLKCMPLTTLPLSTSKHGITLLVRVMLLS